MVNLTSWPSICTTFLNYPSIYLWLNGLHLTIILMLSDMFAAVMYFIGYEYKNWNLIIYVIELSFLLYFFVYYLCLSFYLLVQLFCFTVVAVKLWLQLGNLVFQVSDLFLQFFVVASSSWCHRRWRWRGGLIVVATYLWLQFSNFVFQFFVLFLQFLIASCSWCLLFSSAVFSNLKVIEFIIFFTICHFSITLHISVKFIVNLLVLPHSLNFSLDTFKRREVSKVEISIVLYDFFIISHTTHSFKDLIDFSNNFFIAISILSLFVVPHLNYLFGTHMLNF